MIVWGFESLIICGVAGLLRIIERNEDMQKISAGTALASKEPSFIITVNFTKPIGINE